MSGYIGIDGLSKKINKLYIGVDGVSKSVSKAYIGVDGASKKWFGTSVDPTKSTLTEDEFIEICENGLQDQMTIGAIITLDNSYQNTWEVIGINHDGTTGTVDIMSHTNINAMKFNSSSNEFYQGSLLQTFCNETIPNAFTNSTTKGLIKTMDVVSNSSTLIQYGKALSVTEVGYSHEYAKVEGTSYGLSGYMFRGGVSSSAWTRTRSLQDAKSWAWFATSSLMNYNYVYKYTRGVLPVLRF